MTRTSRRPRRSTMRSDLKDDLRMPLPKYLQLQRGHDTSQLRAFPILSW